MSIMGERGGTVMGFWRSDQWFRTSWMCGRACRKVGRRFYVSDDASPEFRTMAVICNEQLLCTRQDFEGRGTCCLSTTTFF